ncbi:response regulator [Niallia taxi]|uniref:response regulator n=1 Tax=Niallia taxi TaxID=2499688 RepID=UPI003981F1CF
MIRTVIIDDEELSIIYLEKKLRDFPNIQIINTYTTFDSVLEELEKKEVNVIFLDIEMGSLNGLEIAERILSAFPSIHIVFVTAHSEYAVHAFEINSIDYLLKPITTKRLQITIDRLNNYIKEDQKSHNDDKTIKPLTIKCFSELRIYQDHKLVPFKTKKAKELFAYLLTHISQYIHKDILIESIWPDQDYQKAKVYLHTCLSHLRKMLASLGYPECISFSNNCYSLSLSQLHCDSISLDKELESLNSITKENKNFVLDLLQQYTGPYLELNQYDWANERAQYYHERILILYDKLIEFLEREEPEKALFLLQQRLKWDPYSDRTVQKSMELLIQRSYRSEAVRLYRDFEELLNNDLDIKPEPSLVKMYHSLTKN